MKRTLSIIYHLSFEVEDSRSAIYFKDKQQAMFAVEAEVQALHLAPATSDLCTHSTLQLQQSVDNTVVLAIVSLKNTVPVEYSA